MNNNKINHYIRLQNLYRLIFPVLIVLIIAIFVKRFNLTNFMLPKNIDKASQIDSTFDFSTPFVKTELKNLTYTGYNYTINGKVKGGYYYYIEDNRCYFAVLKPTDNKFPEYIENITVSGKIESDSSTLPKLTQLMSEDLDWSNDELVEISSPYIINQILFNHRLLIAITFLLILLLAICFGNIIALLSGILFPFISMSNMHCNNWIILRKMLKNAEEELHTSLIYNNNNMYITENYFINLSYTQAIVVPLDQIVWAYYHSVLHRNILFKHTITYSLRLVTDKKYIYTAPKKVKNSCIEVLDIISTKYPEILIGYSDENHIDFIHSINSFIDVIKSYIINKKNSN